MVGGIALSGRLQLVVAFTQGLKTFDPIVIGLGLLVVDLIRRLSAFPFSFDPPLALVIVEFQSLLPDYWPVRRQPFSAVAINPTAHSVLLK